MFPTVLELCGIERGEEAPKLDGRSLVPVIADPQAPDAHEVLHFAWRGEWAVRRGGWKLIQTKNGISLRRLSDAQPEVKDHAADQPRIVDELTALHEAWAAKVALAP